ncbi:major facilitator superfamily domain-containing protein 12-like [Uloborus diversus]|uniref:major facilitator superfamily domain-containing protein 12-like n=1 Tax=Uloborus diversus TaxID=327109 RepID=UPI00240A46D3|nr:major facilitator superfamily domain-containing protein 12-like [Uloborus diversus]
MDKSTRLPWSQRISFGVGHCLNDLTASMWFSYLMVYLQLVLGFDAINAGLVLLVGQVADAIATPLLGYEVSSEKATGAFCRKYGRRKFLHLFGTICVVISFPFIFSICPGCQNADEYALMMMLIPLVIIFQVGWAAVQVSHLSLIPVITPHEGERDFLNVLRYAFDIASDIGTYVVVWCVIDLTKEPTQTFHTVTGEYANKFMLIVLLIIGIGTFFSMVFHIGVKENTSSPFSSEDNSYDKVRQPMTNLSFPTVEANLSWRGWMREMHFYQVGLLYMLVRVFQNMSAIFMPLYLQESLRANDDFIAKIPLVMNLSGFIVSCFLPKLFKVLSKKITFLAGATIGVGACAWITVGHGTSYCSKGIYVVGAMLGASSSVLNISALSFIHDLIGTSSESGAFVYGFMSFWDKMANGVAAMLVQHLHSTLCKNCDWFYREVMSVGIGGVIIAANIVLITLLPAALGERQSIYNGKKSNSKMEEANYQSIDASEGSIGLQEKPMLKNGLSS